MHHLFNSRMFLLLAALLAWATPSHAQTERILDFHSDITLQDDSSLQVTETITVVAEGGLIRHGIFREFPTHYSDPYNNRYVVGFQMLAATRDSAVEIFRMENYFNGVRIYLGDPNAMVPPGRHVYTLTYTTNRQLGFFSDHDELFWNVTGLGWNFRIDHASATVHLLSAIPADQVTLAGFTGPKGSRESELTSSRDADSFQFATTRPLAPREGLSVLLSWPKGYVTPPTFSQKAEYFFRDNRDALLLATGLLVLLLYYLIAWAEVGRDPLPGVIMPLYEPPATLSPAGMRYLVRMGFDNKTFAAAILDMAARGYLKIKEDAGAYMLSLTDKDERVLTPDEKQIAGVLFEDRKVIWLHQENHEIIRAAMAAVQKWLKSAENKVYFVTNSRYLLPPVLLSLAIIVVHLMAQGGPQLFIGAFLGFWLTFWSIGLAALLKNVVQSWHAAFSRGEIPFGNTVKAIFITFFCIPFVGGEVLGLFILLKISSLALVAFIIASGALHIVFLYLMKAPTFAGRHLLDQVEGFKMFLGAVDSDRLNRAMPPQQTPAVFEKFLPYALALDVEQDWANKFSGVLDAAGSVPGHSSAAYYAPSFYSGASLGGFTGANFASSFSNSFTSAISSSSSAPGSGGGGGSGGSGGGGGGGGGGGW
ncbi:MAG TPA: DUF2207 domain-containing protein [Candidatus Acidoferrum sp.]|nr:DUF2207 domain-containing protein [Candidatus Acidoferrum sp.]